MGLFFLVLPIVVMLGVFLLLMLSQRKNEAGRVKTLVIMAVIYAVLVAVKIRLDGIEGLGFFDWFGIVIFLIVTPLELWRKSRAERAGSGATPS